MYKYQIVDELSNLKEVPMKKFQKKINVLKKEQNRIVMFKNKGEMSAFYCTNCQKWHFVPAKYTNHLKIGDYMTCGECNKRSQIISRRNNIDELCKYLTFLEVNARGEVIIRLFYYYRSYDKHFGTFSDTLLEVERINVMYKIFMKNNSYRTMGLYNGTYHQKLNKPWKREICTKYSSYWYYYPYRNVINTKNSINKLMNEAKNMKYSCLDAIVKKNIDVFDYIECFLEEPKLEILVKMNCSNMLKDVLRRKASLKNLSKREMKLIIRNNWGFAELQIYRNIGIADNSYITKAKLIGLENNEDLITFTKDIRKTIDYLEKNAINSHDYTDYMRQAKFLKLDLKDKAIRYPANFKTKHDEVMDQYTMMINKKMNVEIANYASELKKYEFKNNDFSIFPAKSQEELFVESNKLKHCVKTYCEKVARRETSIFFIRKNKELDVPYVTLELKKRNVIQCRANCNAKPNNNIIVFVNKWCKRNDFRSCFS